MKGYNTRSVWIISAEIRYLLSEQKKFQNKSKNWNNERGTGNI